LKVISIKQIHHQTKMLVIIDDYVLLLFKITVYLLVKKYQVNSFSTVQPSTFQPRKIYAYNIMQFSMYIPDNSGNKID